jgi:hypothetical protein
VLKKKHKYMRRDYEELQAEYRQTLEQNIKGQEEIKALIAMTKNLEQRLRDQKTFYERTI